MRDVAQQVHRGMAAELKFARVWGKSAEFDGKDDSGQGDDVTAASEG